MKPITKLFILALLLTQFSCGLKYTCNCTVLRYDYSASGKDSTLLTSSIITEKRAYTHHSAEQKCFSSYASEPEISASPNGNKVVTTTTCVVY